MQLAQSVAELGSSLLAACGCRALILEMLRNTQETALLNLTTMIKQQRLDELKKTLEGLSRDRSQFQVDHYTAGAQTGGPDERTTRALMAEAIYFQAVSVPVHGIAIAGYVSPSIFLVWPMAACSGAMP